MFVLGLFLYLYNNLKTAPKGEADVAFDLTKLSEEEFMAYLDRAQGRRTKTTLDPDVLIEEAKMRREAQQRGDTNLLLELAREKEARADADRARRQAERTVSSPERKLSSRTIVGFLFFWLVPIFVIYLGGQSAAWVIRGFKNNPPFVSSPRN